MTVPAVFQINIAGPVAFSGQHPPVGNYPFFHCQPAHFPKPVIGINGHRHILLAMVPQNHHIGLLLQPLAIQKAHQFSQAPVMALEGVLDARNGNTEYVAVGIHIRKMGQGHIRPKTLHRVQQGGLDKIIQSGLAGPLNHIAIPAVKVNLVKRSSVSHTEQEI